MKLSHLDLFSGIGGFALAARTCDINTIAFCEQDDFCCKILRKHFPNTPIYKDVRRLIREESDAPYDGEYNHRHCNICDKDFYRCECIIKQDFIDFLGRPWLITAGFPCQDISNAITAQDSGPQGLAGKKSSLWYETKRIISRLQPNVVILENVASIRVRGADEIIDQLDSIGYHCWPFVVGSEDVGGQIKRKRAWFIAIQKSECTRLQGKVIAELAQQESRPRGPNTNIAGPNWGRATSRLRGKPNGVPHWMDRIKSLGNSLTPEIPLVMMKSLKRLYER